MAAGKKRYFTGVPCAHGHICERFTSSKGCLECAYARDKLKRVSDPAIVRANDLRHRQSNPENRHAIDRAWRVRNPGYRKKLRLLFPEKVEEQRLRQSRNRRARHAGAKGRFTAADVALISKAQGHKCAYCRISFKKTKPQVDHIQPLFLGGSNERTNLQLLCRPCNGSKGAKPPIVFAQQRGLLL